MNASTAAASSRDAGIEIARISAMLLIVLVHIVNLGGLWRAAELQSGSSGAVCALLYALGVCGVNCYALISGYVGVGTPFRVWKILPLWLQTFATGLAVVAAFAAFRPGSTQGADWLTALFPISSDEYWYVSAYFGAFFLFPFLNRLLFALSSRERAVLSWTIFILAAILPCGRRIWIGDDSFELNAGYSAAWLSLLYLVGGCLRLDGNSWRILRSRSRNALFFLLSVACMTGIELLLQSARPATAKFAALSYDSPLPVAASFFLLASLRSISVKGILRKWILLFGSASFGVFLIHAHPLCLDAFFRPDAFAGLAQRTPLAMAFFAIGASIVVYFLCAMADCVRIALFRVLRVRTASERLFRPIAGLFPDDALSNSIPNGGDASGREASHGT